MRLSLLSRPALLITALGCLALASGCGDDEPELIGGPGTTATPTVAPTGSGTPTASATPTGAPCDGCTDVNGNCVAGDSDTACGRNGAACAVCDPGQACMAAACMATDTGCLGGCEDSSGECLPGTANDACGRQGDPCIACDGGETCTAGVCEDACNFATCGNGCCGEDGCDTSIDETSCGGNGSACVPCAEGEVCTNGECVEESQETCDAESCADGCCVDDQCLSGTTSVACGGGGQACAACNEGDVCNDRACETPEVTCGPENCGGCCNADNVCVEGPGQSDGACGRAGENCNTCVGAETCIQGACISDQPCLDFCTEGCCTAQGQCISVSDQDEGSCGVGGLCDPCADGLFCVGGTCSEDPGWQVWIVSAVIEPTDENGNNWDGFFDSDPDPYAAVGLVPEEGGIFDLSNSWSNTISDTYTPNWNEQLSTYRTSDLFARGLRVSIRDSDGFGGVPFETIGLCEPAVTQDDLDAGEMTIETCGVGATNVRLLFIQDSAE